LRETGSIGRCQLILNLDATLENINWIPLFEELERQDHESRPALIESQV
jgi:hypothetical protein